MCKATVTSTRAQNDLHKLTTNSVTRLVKQRAEEKIRPQGQADQQYVTPAPSTQ